MNEILRNRLRKKIFRTEEKVNVSQNEALFKDHCEHFRSLLQSNHLASAILLLIGATLVPQSAKRRLKIFESDFEYGFAKRSPNFVRQLRRYLLL